MVFGKIFGNVVPRRQACLIFGQNSLVIGTCDKPHIEKGLTNIMTYPSVNDEGDFSQNFKKPLVDWSADYIMEVKALPIIGMPKTGLLLYVHPSNPIVNFINKDMMNRVHLLEEQKRALEARLRIAERGREEAVKGSDRDMMSKSKTIGKSQRLAKAYGNQDYGIPMPVGSSKDDSEYSE